MFQRSFFKLLLFRAHQSGSTTCGCELNYELFCVRCLVHTYWGHKQSPLSAVLAFQDREVYNQHEGQTCLLAFLTYTEGEEEEEGWSKGRSEGKKEAKFSAHTKSEYFCKLMFTLCTLKKKLIKRDLFVAGIAIFVLLNSNMEMAM